MTKEEAIKLAHSVADGFNEEPDETSKWFIFTWSSNNKKESSEKETNDHEIKPFVTVPEDAFLCDAPFIVVDKQTKKVKIMKDFDLFEDEEYSKLMKTFE